MKDTQITNDIIDIQKMLKTQMENLMEQTIPREISREVARSGALSQNAQAFLKAVSTSLRVKDMTKNNPAAEETILHEIGVINEEK